ncbi:MAG: hypothetical protein Q7R48_02300 [bacterium]|nr:hypothetical protein [bacterium]
MKIVSFKDVIRRARQLAWYVGRHAFPSFLALFCCALVIAQGMTWYASFRVERREYAQDQEMRFRPDFFEQMKEIWKERDQKFQGVSAKTYPAIFRPRSSLTE